MTCRPLLTLTGVHLKTHTSKKPTYTICHRISGPLTDRRGRWYGTVVRYSISVGNSLDQNITAPSQIPEQTPSGPTQSPWCTCPPFARIWHANSFRPSILVLGVWETQKWFPSGTSPRTVHAWGKKTKQAILTIICAGKCLIPLSPGALTVTFKPLNWLTWLEALNFSSDLKHFLLSLLLPASWLNHYIMRQHMIQCTRWGTLL